jgi:hypothetical protein
MTDSVRELDEGQKNVLRKIEALLRVADKGKDSEDAHTANEAASAERIRDQDVWDESLSRELSERERIRALAAEFGE